MKKFIVILMGIFFFYGMTAYATEQNIKNDQSYGTLNIQKTPETDGQKQKIDNHFTFFTINIQINGKIKDTDTANK